MRVLIGLALTIAGGAAAAAPEPPGPPPGGGMSLRQAGRRADLIVVATVGAQAPGGGRGFRGGRQFEVRPVATLKGAPEAMNLRVISVRSRNQDDDEPPQEGEDYIFFIERTDWGPRAFKAVRKTPENLRDFGGVAAGPGSRLMRPQTTRMNADETMMV